MKKLATLIIHNLKKAKGQYLSFGIFICLTAFIINIALVLAFQTFDAYDDLFDELDTADVNFIIPKMQDNEDLLAEVEEIDGVSLAEKHGGLFTSVTVREFAGSDFDMNTVFYNIDEERTLNLLDIQKDAGAADDSAYIPLYMRELGGFAEKSDITYSIDGREHTYPVGGIVQEMQYGNYGTGLIGGYLPEALYEELAEEYDGSAVTEYSVRADKNADLNELKNGISEMIKDKGIALISIGDRATAKQTRTMVCTLLIVIFLALAAIILVVSIFLSNFRIKSAIEDELAQMGVLKAIGYTSNMIIAATVMPYVLVGALAAIAGIAASYAVLPFVAGILAVQSGFSYTPVFDITATLITGLILIFAILLFSYLSAGKIYKLEPINAIRGVVGAESAGQNILLFIVSFGIMVLLSFAGTLLYNVTIKPDNFMNTLSEELPSVIFTAEDGKMAELKELLENDTRVSLLLEYASVPVSYTDGSLTAFVCEDFSKVTNDICYEGRSPEKENEIAVGNALADDYPIGGKIEITVGSKAEDYTVTGYIQSVNNAGAVCQLTGKGYEKIGEKPDSVNVYLHEKEAGAFIKEYEEKYDTVVKASVNFEQMNENGQKMYTGIVSAVVLVLFVISVLMVLLVMYVIINSMLSRRRQEFGIYKAIGYTNRQLTMKTALAFIPVVAGASFISAAAGLWYLPAIDNVIFSLIGAVKNHFEVSILILIAFAAAFTAAAFIISVLLSAPIKKITAYSLLKD
ncbi:MAG: ABC transporter permease [Bacteroidales bacterium]|nr:ABC transporter permease [Bacteroidales bacterium]MCM1414820.1 ABC transporter permease [bacterium]MCM1422451.1 ABC transporter permease [bacterium]